MLSKLLWELFSPITGFMDKNDVVSVLKEYKLSSGDVWTLPIVLQCTKELANIAKFSDQLKLQHKNDDYAIIENPNVYQLDLIQTADLMFGTTNSNHPGVANYLNNGDWFISGKVTLIKRLSSNIKPYELTPNQARTIFENKGWSRVVGFHTRNVLHQAHEHIQMKALKDHHCDGMFIHPVVGPKKKGDYEAYVIMKSYEIAQNYAYPSNTVVLGAFQNYSRYAGPREAIFTALCRKNFGCSHFIVGRDHTGVADFYSSDQSQKLFDTVGDIGITPVFFNTYHYCNKCKKYVDQCEHNSNELLTISGTQGREMISIKIQPPEWFMRKPISDMLINEIKMKKSVFVS